MTSIDHCSVCGGPTKIVVPNGDNRERAVCQRCGHIHYINPKVVVGAVCTHADRLLLCRRAIEPRRGFWTIPAGFMENGETAEEGAAREAMEEACADISLTRLLAVYSIKRIDQVQLLFAARLRSADVAAGLESLEVKLVTWDAIPWDDLAFPSVHWVLEHARRLTDLHAPAPPMLQPSSPTEPALAGG